MKKISDLTKYKGVLPYASEMFGVYQPLLGWKSARKTKRIQDALNSVKSQFMQNLLNKYSPDVQIEFASSGQTLHRNIEVGSLSKVKLNQVNESRLLQIVSTSLQERDMPNIEEWKQLLSKEALTILLKEKVFSQYQEVANSDLESIQAFNQMEVESDAEFVHRKATLVNDATSRMLSNMNKESVIAALLVDWSSQGMNKPLEELFYKQTSVDVDEEIRTMQQLLQDELTDPYLSFDPKKDIKNVVVSPLGVVHLYRQYFFELDTFLGSPVEHVWLSPGSSVELVEINTHKTTTEKSFEYFREAKNTTESTTTLETDLNSAVEKDNQNNLKAGFSMTTNASYPVVSISANASLNLDKMEHTANKETNKILKNQSAKLSSEIRENFKTTFKTVTEDTTYSSKKYLLKNDTGKLINYELRRKMRQVGVQAQDMGTYLCWETFVDEPGTELGLANLLHIAKPADLIIVPDPTVVPPMVENINLDFVEKYTWLGGDKSVPYDQERIIWGESKKIEIPEGYELNDDDKNIYNWNWASGVDPVDHTRWAFKFRVESKTTFRIGLYIDPSYLPKEGFNVDESHTFNVTGSIPLKLTNTKRQEIATANSNSLAAGKAANNENKRKTEESFIKDARDRITAASKITKRNFEELREEERTIIYRKLIRSLMTDTNYDMPDSKENYEPRHVMSELLNSIFDIDKMLYFVAPEWWKPRKHSHQHILSSNEGLSPSRPLKKMKSFNMKESMSMKYTTDTIPKELKPHITNWSDQENREDNYYITDDSNPAPLGSSLGWLLQLDGDNQRNTFLNSPWVKAVIPIRPGKEMAATAWLQNVHVEGSDGLNAHYEGTEEELKIISDKLKAAYPTLPSSNPPTIADALRFLCLEISTKEELSTEPGLYPQGKGIDDSDIVLSTPIDKVYEHGFYPLQGGFKANVNPDEVDEKDKHFNVLYQWLEILPTNQVVPVEVEYNPIDGRMKA